MCCNISARYLSDTGAMPLFLQDSAVGTFGWLNYRGHAVSLFSATVCGSADNICLSCRAYRPYRLIDADWERGSPGARVDAAGGERSCNCECQMVEYGADGVCHAGAVPVHDAYAFRDMLTDLEARVAPGYCCVDLFRSHWELPVTLVHVRDTARNIEFWRKVVLLEHTPSCDITPWMPIWTADRSKNGVIGNSVRSGN